MIPDPFLDRVIGPYRIVAPLGAGGMKVSETICHRVLALPMHPYLDEATQAKIADSVRGFAKAGG